MEETWLDKTLEGFTNQKTQKQSNIKKKTQENSNYKPKTEWKQQEYKFLN